MACLKTLMDIGLPGIRPEDVRIHCLVAWLPSLSRSNFVLKEMQQAMRQPVESSGKATGNKADVSAFAREFELHRSGNLIGPR